MSSTAGFRPAGAPLRRAVARLGSMYIAGVLPHEPGNLIAWIQDPPAISPKTAMPRLGVTPADARDIAAYLYSTK